ARCLGAARPSLPRVYAFEVPTATFRRRARHGGRGTSTLTVRTRSPGSRHGTGGAGAGLPGGVEAAGIEPASADAPARASTSLGSRLLSPAGRWAADLPTG